MTPDEEAEIARQRAERQDREVRPGVATMRRRPDSRRALGHCGATWPLLPLVFDAPARGAAAPPPRRPRRRPSAGPRSPRSAARPFRADQLSRHYFGRLETDPAAMTDLPAAARDRLVDALLPALLTEVRHRRDRRGTTRKTLWRLHDGTLVESVLMRYPRTGHHGVRVQPGRLRDGLPVLRDRPGRPDPQPVHRRDRRPGRSRPRAPWPRGELPGGPGRLSNVVFMGMGEPLANYPRVVAALHRLIDPPPAGLGLSQRSITVSTVGLVPGDRPAGRRGPRRHAGGVAARAGRRTARHPGAGQHPLDGRRGARRPPTATPPGPAAGTRSSTR